MKVTDKAMIFKNDKGVYKASIARKYLDENGEEVTKFMNVHVGFRKGVEVKNKTKIDIKNGFMTFFEIPTGNTYEDGTPEYRNYIKIMILDFEVLEEGVDEPVHSRNYSQAGNTESEEVETYPELISDDELPF